MIEERSTLLRTTPWPGQTDPAKPTRPNRFNRPSFQSGTTTSLQPTSA